MLVERNGAHGEGPAVVTGDVEAARAGAPADVEVGRAGLGEEGRVLVEEMVERFGAGFAHGETGFVRRGIDVAGRDPRIAGGTVEDAEEHHQCREGGQERSAARQCAAVVIVT